MALVGQGVEDGRELPNGQHEEDVEMPELSASLDDQTGGQGVQESRPGVVHVLGRGGKGAVIPVPYPTSKILKLKCGRDFGVEF